LSSFYVVLSWFVLVLRLLARSLATNDMTLPVLTVRSPFVLAYFLSVPRSSVFYTLIRRNAIFVLFVYDDRRHSSFTFHFTTTTRMSKKRPRPILLLGILVVQNTLAALVGRYTRSSNRGGGGGTGAKSNSNNNKEELYDIRNFLLICELGKLVLSLVLEAISRQSNTNTNTNTNITLSSSSSSSSSIGKDHSTSTQPQQHYCYYGPLWLLLQSLRRHIWNWETLRMAPPALLYFGSNTCRYVAQGHLNVPIFQVTVQSRLVTTAALSVLLLKRSYALRQWICLITISLGVALVVLTETIFTTTTASTTSLSSQQQNPEDMMLGLLSLGTACVLSSLASVYFESVLKRETTKKGMEGGTNVVYKKDEDHPGGDEQMEKGTNNTSCKQTRPPVILIPPDDEPSLWMRNIQLALFSVLVAILQGATMGAAGAAGGYSGSSPQQPQRPFFHGFHGWVWVQVVLFSGGGILVAAVTKYADSVIKGLATAVSMLLSSSLSAVVFSSSSAAAASSSSSPILRFLCFGLGGTMIVTSVYLFSNPFLPSSSLRLWCHRGKNPSKE
jgi:UDP-sugar transporter A1/2/3